MGFYRTIAIAAACLLSACASPPKAPMPVGGERAPANDPAQIRQFLIESEEVQRLSEQNAELKRVLTQSKGQVLDMRRYVLSLQEERSRSKVRAVKQEKVISDGKQFKKKVKTIPADKPNSNIVVPAQIKPKARKPKSKAVAKSRESKKPKQTANIESVASASKITLSAPQKVTLRGEQSGERSKPNTAPQPQTLTEQEIKITVSKILSPAENKNRKAFSRLPPRAKSQKVDTTIKKDSTTYTFYHDVEDASFSPSIRVNEKMLSDANTAKKVIVVGSADSRKSTTRNKLLAKERGNNAKRYLVNHGVDESLIKVALLPSGGNLSSRGEEELASENGSVQITVFN